MKQSFTGIILAAGSSKRLQTAGINTAKPLLKIGTETFLSKAIQNCRSVGECLVVLGHQASELAEQCKKLDVPFCVNHNHHKGQTSSLKIGIENLPETTTHFFIYPVDYPLIQKQTLKLLIEAEKTTHQEIVLPTYEGKGGHPVLISISLKEEFLSLQEDEPASLIIHRDSNRVNRISVQDFGVIQDVDTFEDYQRLKEYLQ
jgi:CTP:molybdopterin cytidylyltransferase MocA